MIILYPMGTPLQAEKTPIVHLINKPIDIIEENK